MNLQGMQASVFAGWQMLERVQPQIRLKPSGCEWRQRASARMRLKGSSGKLHKARQADLQDETMLPSGRQHSARSCPAQSIKLLQHEQCQNIAQARTPARHALCWWPPSA